MDVYVMPEEEKTIIKNLVVPLAVYQFVNKKVITICVSKGFMDLFDLQDYDQAVKILDYDMYASAEPEDAARIADAAFEFAEKDGTYDCVYRNYFNKDGKNHLIHAFGNHDYREDGTRLAYVWYTDETKALSLDNTLQKGLDKNIKITSELRKNNYDDLTGLPNMFYFIQLADAWYLDMLKEHKKAVIVYMDLDGLKYYNHHYDFQKGDKLIQETADILKKYFGNESVGRFGADHFVVYAEYDGIFDTLNHVFEEVKKAVNGCSLPLRAGVYLYEDPSVDLTTACDNAKIACDSKRNLFASAYVVYDEKMNHKALLREYILTHFSEALKKGWIKDYYQPIVSSANTKVSDEEVLARWCDPEKGILPPDSFIPVLEDAGLLYRLDLYMVDRVIENLKMKEKMGIHATPISVNLSERDFTSCDMVEEINKRLDAAGISRKMITIEITERAIGREPKLLKDVIQDFHDAGYEVWLDDFGSDYSSLNILQNFNFELIKLDMKFLRQFDENKISRLIIEEMLDLANKAGIKTVTEGVETKEQALFLKNSGCTKLQGYYFGKPQSVEDLRKEYLAGNTLVYENQG